MVFGASAIIDRNDVIPASLTASGGTIVQLGMPVDPGNLLLLGSLDDASVIGVPSCAASIKINGFDWVLERLFADLPVSRDEIVAMAAGGLLSRNSLTSNAARTQIRLYNHYEGLGHSCH